MSSTKQGIGSLMLSSVKFKFIWNKLCWVVNHSTVINVDAEKGRSVTWSTSYREIDYWNLLIWYLSHHLHVFSPVFGQIKRMRSKFHHLLRKLSGQHLQPRIHLKKNWREGVCVVHSSSWIAWSVCTKLYTSIIGQYQIKELHLCRFVVMNRISIIGIRERAIEACNSCKVLGQTHKQAVMAINIGLPLPSPPQKRQVSAYRASRASKQRGNRRRGERAKMDPAAKPHSVLVAIPPARDRPIHSSAHGPFLPPRRPCTLFWGGWPPWNPWWETSRSGVRRQKPVWEGGR